MTIFHEYGGLSHARFAREGAPLKRNDETFIHDVRVLDDVYSDHSVVVCPKLPPSKVLVKYRANSNFHSDMFSSDLLNSVQQLANTKDLNLLVD